MLGQADYDPAEIHPDTQAMLTTLRVKSVANLNEDVWETFTALHIGPSNPTR